MKASSNLLGHILLLSGFAVFAAGCSDGELPTIDGSGGNGIGGEGGTGAGDVGGSGGGDGRIACETVAQCPNPDVANECMVKTCTQNVCGFEPAPAGSSRTTAGQPECHARQCNGLGDFEVVVDDNNKPKTDIPCRVGKCSDGTSSIELATPGASCGTELMCDADGKCIGCEQDSQCTGGDECKTPVCNDGTCEFDNLEEGFVLATQTDGDCQVRKCGAAGAIVNVPDDDDVPADKDCQVASCVDGEVHHTNLAEDTACGSDMKCDAEGECSKCTRDDQCGLNTFCAEFACVDGGCEKTPTNVGAALPDEDQNPGDCSVKQCNDVGEVVNEVDNDDLPYAAACKVAKCTDGDPSVDNAEDGDACSDDSELTCNASGECTGCEDVSACPDANNPCLIVVCNADKICEYDFVVADTPLPDSEQTDGDCRVWQCNGAGSLVWDADDDDVPTDADECHQNLCSEGNPVYPPADSGTNCDMPSGATGVCSTTQECVECNVAADCGVTDACAIFSCQDNVCDVEYPIAGTEVDIGDIGDCQGTICDGAGNTVLGNWDTDIPTGPTDECVVNACSDGHATTLPVGVGTECTGGVCDGGGECFECINASHCKAPGLEQCSIEGKCVECTDHVQCEGNGGTDLCVGYECVPRSVECEGSSECTDPTKPICAESGLCVACVLPTHCGDFTPCQEFDCTALGVCIPINASNGKTEGLVQPGGTCIKNQCDGNGSVEEVPDPSNIVTDEPPPVCNVHACDGKIPVLNPVARGVTDGVDPEPVGTCRKKQCDGNGLVEWIPDASNVKTDPPAPLCSVHACNGGDPVLNHLARGDDTGLTQPVGNCKRLECNGSGGIDTIDDPSNISPIPPTDQCAVNVCNGGTPGFGFAPAGTACTGDPNAKVCTAVGECRECNNNSHCGDQVCNLLNECEACTTDDQCDGMKCDAGNCVPWGNCAVPADCGASTACRQYVCVDGECSSDNAPAGSTAGITQVEGDCHELKCNGGGNIDNVIDDNDVATSLPPACRIHTCLMGVPGTAVAPVGTECADGGGTICTSAGACVACLNTSHCDRQVCNTANACVPCTVDLECGTGLKCVDGLCSECADDTECGTATDCTTYSCVLGECNTTQREGAICADGYCDSEGHCFECVIDAHCPVGVCKLATHECVECLTDTNCAVGNEC
ncbi:MAG: hypothetical protein FWD57_06360, partial [Polyangiaceae bacterium]|nr:hypothetical protein [Polyangiaceae bacterium]